MARLNKEALLFAGAVVLVAALTATTARSEFGRAKQAEPSSYSVGPAGYGAAYRLLRAEGYPVGRLEAPYTSLPSQPALIIACTPFDRAVESAEAARLDQWLRLGGVLVLVEGAAEDTLNDRFGIRLDQASARRVSLIPEDPASPFMKDVSKVRVSGELRVARSVGKRFHTLVASGGAYLITWQHLLGRVLAATDGIGWNNRNIAADDNAVLLVNIAGWFHALHPEGRILFDEYHHGYGINTAAPSLWQIIGSVGRGLLFYGLGVFVLVVVNLNRRFGTPRPLPQGHRVQTLDYVTSMGALYRRARATDLPIEILYRDLVRVLTTRLDLPPDAATDAIVRAAGSILHWNETEVGAVLRNCEAVLATRTASEAEMLTLARALNNLRRRAESARP
ncbi:MAG: DUF4350 domain-containing protein [Chthonomonadales bacterium]